MFLKKSGLGQKMLDKRMETMTPLKASGSDSLNRTADLDQTDDRMVKKRYRYDGESSISDSSSSSDEIPSSVRRKEKEKKEKKRKAQKQRKKAASSKLDGKDHGMDKNMAAANKRTGLFD